MNRNVLLILLCTLAFSLLQVYSVSAQSAKELEEMMNEPAAGTKEAKKKEKTKAEKPQKEAKVKEEKPKEAKQEKPKEEKQEAPKPEKAKEEKPKPEKQETKPATENATQVKAEKKKEEPKPAETKKEKEPKKEAAKPAETKKEKKEESKPEKAEDRPAATETTGLSYGKNKSLGKKAFKRGNVASGIRYYNAAENQKPGKKKMMQSLADGYLASRNYEEAARWYQRLAIMDSAKFKSPINHFNHALCLKHLGRYEEAKAAFAKFNKRAGDNEDLIPWKSRSKKEIEGCDMAISLMNNPDKKQELKVSRMGEQINQPFDDVSPVMQGKTAMLFAARSSDEMVAGKKRDTYASPSRMYFSILKGKEWLPRQEMPAEINAPGMHVGNPAFSPDMKTMVYTQCTQDETGRMRCDLYQSKYEDNKWQAGTKLDATVNLETANNTHPCFGKNESGATVLFFASDRNPGKGMDLFVSEMNDKGKFMKARTLATPVNTKGDEVTPWFDYKTKTLYFSSNGHINIGGLDVFKSKYVNGDFTEPENLGLLVNSSSDDYFYSMNTDLPNGFFVSNRSGGNSAGCPTCHDDIFIISKKQLQLIAKGMLVEQTDTSRGYAKEGMVTLYDADEGTELKNFRVVGGRYEFAVEPDKNYKLVSRKDEHFNDGVVLFTTKGMYNDSVLDYDVYLVSKNAYSLVGLRIGTVYWAYNDFRLIGHSKDTLDQVLDFVKGHPEVIIEVGSHTDSKGSDDYNEKLSKKRSDAVMKYLVYSNVPQERVVSKAYGETQPAEPNTNPDGSDNPEGRAKNRRTEFKVIEEIKR